MGNPRKGGAKGKAAKKKKKNKGAYSQSQQTFQERGKKDILRFPSFSPPSLSLMYNESVEAICKTSIKAFHASFPLCFVYLSKTVVFTFVSQNMGVQIYVQYFLNYLFIYFCFGTIFFLPPYSL